MPVIKISEQATLHRIENLLLEALNSNAESIAVTLARSRKVHFFKDALLSSFFGTLRRHHQFTLRDGGTSWDNCEIVANYGENLAGLAGCIHAKAFVNAKRVPSPLQAKDLRDAIDKRGGLLKVEDSSNPNIRELAFIAFDPELDEPLALANLTHDPDGFIRTIIDYKRRLLDRRQDTHPDLFGAGETGQRALMEFIFELYQNGAEHGNQDGMEGLSEGSDLFQLDSTIRDR
jgi:hypothetical protein